MIKKPDPKGSSLIVAGEGYNNTKEINRVPFQDIMIDDKQTAGELLKAFKNAQATITSLQDENAKINEKCALYQKHLTQIYAVLEIILQQASITNIDLANIKNILNNQEDK